MTARTPAPKAEDYSVVPGSLGPRRDFRIPPQTDYEPSGLCRIGKLSTKLVPFRSFLIVS
jgi:hypothetical protein